MYEKKKVEDDKSKQQRLSTNGNGTPVPVSLCGFCQRPSSNVYCLDCKHVCPKKRVRKTCADHPKGFFMMDLDKCPKCKGSNLDEVEDGEIPTAPLQERSPSWANIQVTLQMDTGSTPAKRCVRSNVQIPASVPAAEQRVASNAQMPIPVQGASPTPPRHSVRSNIQVPTLLEAASFPARLNVRSNVQLPTPMDVSVAPERVPVTTPARLNIHSTTPGPSRSQVVSNPFIPSSAPENSDVKLFESTISGNTTPPPPWLRMDVSGIGAGPLLGSSSTVSTVTRAPLSSSMPSQPPVPIIAIARAEAIHLPGCVCQRSAKWIICTACGHFEPKGRFKKHIHCDIHPRAVNGLTKCIHCEAPSSELDEGDD